MNEKNDTIINERLSVPTRGQKRTPDFLCTNQIPKEKVLRTYRDLK
jgi:hypothetical protein